MEEKHIFEGKTSTEAIEKGLKELNLKREEVVHALHTSLQSKRKR